MRRSPDTFYVAATTAKAGWAVYRRQKKPGSRPTSRVWVYLDSDPTNTPLTIPKGAIKITTHDRVQASRAAIRLTVLDSGLADALAAANALHKLAVYDVIDRYNA